MKKNVEIKSEPSARRLPIAPYDWQVDELAAIKIPPLLHESAAYRVDFCSARHFAPLPQINNQPKRKLMLSWTIIFLIIAIIAGVLGFGGIAGTAAGIAQILFTIFLILFLVSIIAGRRRV